MLTGVASEIGFIGVPYLMIKKVDSKVGAKTQSE
jgi:hypothetical protein